MNDTCKVWRLKAKAANLALRAYCTALPEKRTGYHPGDLLLWRNRPYRVVGVSASWLVCEGLLELCAGKERISPTDKKFQLQAMTPGQWSKILAMWRKVRECNRRYWAAFEDDFRGR